MYTVSDEKNAKWKFQIPAKAPEKIVSEISCGALVIGAGLGGLSAAVRLKELGADVLLIEKSGSFSGRGGHFGVAWSSLMEQKGVKHDLSEIARQWITMSGNNVDEELVWLYLKRGGEAMNWLLEKAFKAGVNVNLVDCAYPSAPYREFLGAHSFKRPDSTAKTIRGSTVSALLFAEAEKLGVKTLFNTAAYLLIKDDSGKVCGAYAKTAEGSIRINAENGVILATGDIGGDEEMCRAFAPDALRTAASQYVPVGCNTGDGHKMGLWAGAAMAEEVFPIMMHPQHYAMFNLVFLYVNQKGRRFMNEDSYVQGRATALMRQPGGCAYSILAEDWKENLKKSLAYGGGIFWGDAGLSYGTEWTPEPAERTIEAMLEAGKGYKADTLEELARLIGVPEEEFLATVAKYNADCYAGRDSDFGKRPELLYPLEKGPFVALKIGTALLEVVGGLKIDTKMRVLDNSGEPIENLYAVGDTTGGCYGHEYVTTILGNSHGRALTWGFIAAESICK